MANRIISIVVGVIVGVLVVTLGEMIQHQFYPVPEGLDFKDKEAMKAFVETMSMGALVSLVFIWILSSFIGGLIAARIAKTRWQLSAMITGGILLLGAILNMFMIPHPVWMVIVTVLLYLPAAYLGGMTGKR